MTLAKAMHIFQGQEAAKKQRATLYIVIIQTQLQHLRSLITVNPNPPHPHAKDVVPFLTQVGEPIAQPIARFALTAKKLVNCQSLSE